jgi:hypothetical protein
VRVAALDEETALARSDLGIEPATQVVTESDFESERKEPQTRESPHQRYHGSEVQPTMSPNSTSGLWAPMPPIL